MPNKICLAHVITKQSLSSIEYIAKTFLLNVSNSAAIYRTENLSS